ncbi:hypothetical protein A0H81_05843 [Grifola frondosa]|uniref:Uncharacterized protein n=1 Tax=Grifola frondosa TaxID=5627 RepID=A0A1C7MB69_GRIFR|nr:hypothetical protein A0H81_05843 [Grifola frondosa]
MHDDTALPLIQPTPGPWNLKADSAWSFFTSLLHKPKHGKALSASYFSDLDTNLRQVSSEQGSFRGGAGVVTILRYTDSPIGPYDELMIIPGEFTNPSGARLPRITRIFVSTLESVYNGRRNWNFPKELAKFTFTPSPTVSGATEVRVFSATSYSPVAYASAPFFSIRIKPVMRPLPAIRINSKYLPRVSITFVQPPIDASADSAEDCRVGTNKWRMFDTSDYSGSVRPVRWEGLLEDDDPASKKRKKRMANGKEFPDVMPYSVGIHFSNVALRLPVGTVPGSGSH